MDTTAITTLAPMRPSQFLEEKRWPPLDIMNNHQYLKKNLHTINVSTFGSTTTSLRPAELNEETLEKDKKWVPDLQLSLSQTSSNNDGKSDHGFRETKEINTKLSLS
ncbi:hypothetical protein TSUD_69140 [Trifolium subterraneum]|uniref:Uncharacterized protein n=1 Tax=Trifolium subterraneum TaxID=3900 RepID=A0A2Z6N7S7_TRISU|nr:hypothetical protein TSUD_69140 [Trifolium subterraneum]